MVANLNVRYVCVICDMNLREAAAFSVRVIWVYCAATVWVIRIVWIIRISVVTCAAVCMVFYDETKAVDVAELVVLHEECFDLLWCCHKMFSPVKANQMVAVHL